MFTSTNRPLRSRSKLITVLICLFALTAAACQPGSGGDSDPVFNGVELTRSGSISVTQPGTVIENLLVEGHIDIHAANVTIRNTVVADAGHFPVRLFSGALGTAELDEVKIMCTTANGQAGVHPGGYTAHNVDVLGCSEGFRSDPQATVTGSTWNQDLVSVQQMPNPNPNPTPTPAPDPGPAECAPSAASQVGFVGAGLRLDQLQATTSRVLVLDRPGQVLENFRHVGTIVVRAPNVVIRRGLVRFDGSNLHAIKNESTGLVIEDVEIDSQGRGRDNRGMGADAVGPANYTATRVHVKGFADGFKASHNTTIEHSLVEYLSTESSTPSGLRSLHHDAIQSMGGDNITIHCNDLRTRGPNGEFADGQVLQLIGRDGTSLPIRNITVTDNVISGGAMAFRLARAEGATVTGNTFVDGSWRWAPVASNHDWLATVSGLVWHDNRLRSGAEVIDPF